MVARLPAIGLLLVSLGSLAAHGEAPSATELAGRARRAYFAKDYRQAAELYRQAVARGAKSDETAYDGACSAALAGEVDGAFAMLDEAVALGDRNVATLKDDSDLASLRADPRWPKVVAAVESNARSYREVHASPDGAKLITSDVDLFWKVYARLPGAPDPGGLLDHEYLDAGSVGLQDFIANRIVSGQSLYTTIARHPKYYGAIRAQTEKMAAVEPEARRSFRAFKALYDDATFPDVYFVVGALSSGGTASGHGLLLGAEMHGLGPGVPTDELSEWHRNAVHSTKELPSIIAHELMHFQQTYRPKTLLEKAFHEGSADFLASLISTGNFNARAYDYGYAHEAELWKAFQAEMNGNDTSRWLYASSLREGRPADLGYFMGFRIAQAYYNRAKDKKQAVREILTGGDVARILREGRYGDALK